MATSTKREQGDSLNAFGASVRNSDPVSNVTDSSDLHLEKHSSSMISTLAGIKILFNPLSENARVPIRCNLDPVSNVIDSSDVQLQKH
jgi:hypothetical protein